MQMSPTLVYRPTDFHNVEFTAVISNRSNGVVADCVYDLWLVGWNSCSTKFTLRAVRKFYWPFAAVVELDGSTRPFRLSARM